MLNFQRLILGCKFVLNIVLYPIWAIGFIAELCNDPPYQRNGKIDIPVILGLYALTLPGLLIWLKVVFSFM